MGGGGVDQVGELASRMGWLGREGYVRAGEVNIVNIQKGRTW